jgi:hypothetical protein
MARGAIKRGIAFPRRHWVTFGVFGLVRLGLMGVLARHSVLLLLAANFLCYHSANFVTKVVLGYAPEPVYNLASVKV